MTDDDALLAQQLATATPDEHAAILAVVDAEDQAARARQISMVDAALWYATTLRWPVFPIEVGGKRPLVTTFFRHGFKDATCDPDLIRAAWRANPEANLATPTGAAGCGLDVLDIDGPPGFTSLASIKHADCEPDCSAETFCPALGALHDTVALATTGRGGRHYFRPPTGEGNGANLMPGVDYRGAGGYVCLPPSRNATTGRRYTWVTRPAP